MKTITFCTIFSQSQQQFIVASELAKSKSALERSAVVFCLDSE
ncbi:hypothetical protein CVP05_03560 [Conservatibacter flavescens]|uniref:Uncharacterized protein n=1 Tax=Conservatibacter flavescens TaxID=28161 RepID=A0A2M8S489_9PAST|nr:hypothetical protein CVP05_03560 [Conservatibacter flavescens]